ncbi:MAG TPA: transglutaminase-like domain-containing protein [Chthoniobacteraceae bacterium]|nr:transglutaminase-like domain-containing protein [Chthoniobacteraceae bacterium]
MIRQHHAILRLLQDDDPATVGLVKAQLASGGVRALRELQALLALAAAPVAAVHIRDVIAEIEETQADAIFTDLCASFDDASDLEEACWRLAATFSPAENFSDARALLDAWGVEVGRRLRKADSVLDRVETLAEFLSFEARLRGNDRNYYDIDNSLLPAVINSRLGIPITLSLVYIFVAKRAGLPLEGVALPGHFLVRHSDIFLDPYHGGRRVGLLDCRELLARHNMSLVPEHLATATSKQMLARLLANILHVANHSDPPLATKVSGWLDALGAPMRP